MPLRNATILVVCDDPETATKLVQAVTEANGDVVFAANAHEASLRLQHFTFTAAVLGWAPGAAGIAVSIQAKGVPLCILANGHDAVPAGLAATIVQCLEQVVPSLRTLAKPR